MMMDLFTKTIGSWINWNLVPQQQCSHISSKRHQDFIIWRRSRSLTTAPPGHSGWRRPTPVLQVTSISKYKKYFTKVSVISLVLVDLVVYVSWQQLKLGFKLNLTQLYIFFLFANFKAQKDLVIGITDWLIYVATCPLHASLVIDIPITSSLFSSIFMIRHFL